ncbi:MAG: tetratricopeptide repeat protein [Treponema sp.]|jgi:tetratricopeptide (TPR) repeat protein|nr:tetratricopeptide repeat protein [Treponema sp.]
MPTENQKPNIGETLNDFAQRNRRAIFIFFGMILALLAVFAGAQGILGASRNKALAAAEEFNRRYDTLRPDLADPSKSSDVSALLEDLNQFAEKTSGYAGGRVWAMIGSIHVEKQEWPEAEQAYASAAKAAAKTYLAATAFFNAAAAAEEQGNAAGALDYYTQCAALADLFPPVDRARFAIGRLREEQGNIAEALEAYRQLTAGDSDSVWTNLARNRIIFLEMNETEETGGLETENEEGNS